LRLDCAVDLLPAGMKLKSSKAQEKSIRLLPTRLSDTIVHPIASLLFES
jgi:hypothetical protein